jgi:hypothetical protein
MGRDGEQTRRRSRKRSRDASPSSSDSDSFDSPSSPSSSPERRSRSSKRNRSSSLHRHSRKKSDRSRRSRDEDRRRRRRRGQERKRHGGDGGRSSDSQSSEEDRAEEAREIVRDILIELPAIAEELRQVGFLNFFLTKSCSFEKFNNGPCLNFHNCSARKSVKHSYFIRIHSYAFIDNPHILHVNRCDNGL